MFAENTLSKSPKAPPSKPSTKPLKGQKAQIVIDPKVDEWEKRYEELKRRENVLKKFKV